MLPFFPTPYPDELFYSACARYHIWSRNKSYKSTIKDLFGSSSASSIIDLPTRLFDFSEKLAQGTMNQPDKLINKNTLFPFYSPFLSLDRGQTIKYAMVCEGMAKHNYKAEISRWLVKPPAYLKACPKCIEEDLDILGESYWRRIHQATGVYICPVHQCYLQETTVGFNFEKRDQALVPLSEDILENLKSIESPDKFSEFLMIQQGVEWLLNNEVPILGLDALKQRYIYYLDRLGYITVTGLIRHEKFKSSFEDRYGHDFLFFLNCDIGKGKSNNWLEGIIAETSVHPLFHLLLINFLDIGLNDFFTNAVPSKPQHFDNGPWLCLNVAANHYLKPVIKNIEIKRDNNTGDPIGIFSCSCGFIFSRRGPDKTIDDQYKIGKVLDYGSLWKKRLIQLESQGKTKKEMVKAMNVSRSTIYKQLSKLKSVKIKVVNDNRETNQEKKEAYREVWLNEQRQHPDFNRTELIRVATAAFSWLYRNDREWLKENSPIVRKNSKHRSPIKDWGEIDERFSKEVLEIAKKELSSILKPTRITKKRIGKELGKYAWVSKDSHKLPKTMSVIETVTETVEDFQIRRVRWVINDIHQKGGTVKMWKVIYQAGLDQPISIKVSKAIEEEIASYS
ncbi:TnsD family transposase [Peribacillus frigoritolerans]